MTNLSTVRNVCALCLTLSTLSLRLSIRAHRDTTMRHLSLKWQKNTPRRLLLQRVLLRKRLLVCGSPMAFLA